ncbi:MAG TPA: hypothetical protein VM431_15555 [Phycisphaerae bacterium]|nr:hypothetical protein [Phycisphaerae bacterium]
MWNRCALLISILTVLLVAPATQAEPIVVPLAKQAPTIDGHIELAEWSAAAAFDGFGRDGQLLRRRAQGWVAATADTLYVAIRSQLPAEGALAAAVDRDSPKVVFDDAAVRDYIAAVRHLAAAGFPALAPPGR